MTDRVHLDSPRFRRLAKAYSNEYRRMILLLLHTEGMMNLTEISERLDITLQAADYNTDKLLSLGLIKVGDEFVPPSSAVNTPSKYYTVTDGAPVLDPAPSQDALSPSTGDDSGGPVVEPPSPE